MATGSQCLCAVEDEGPNGEQLWVRPGDEGIVAADDSPISFSVSFPEAPTFVAPRSSVTLADCGVGRSEDEVPRFPDPGEDLERLQDSWSAIVEAVQVGGGTVVASQWSVSDVVRAEQHRRRWVEEVFARADDPHDAAWQGALGFLMLPNDDAIRVEVARVAPR